MPKAFLFAKLIFYNNLANGNISLEEDAKAEKFCGRIKINHEVCSLISRNRLLLFEIRLKSEKIALYEKTIVFYSFHSVCF